MAWRSADRCRFPFVAWQVAARLLPNVHLTLNSNKFQMVRRKQIS
jgi:hypothetical protein